MFNCDNCEKEPDTLFIVTINRKKIYLCPNCYAQWLQKGDKVKDEDFMRDYCAICTDGGNCLGCEL